MLLSPFIKRDKVSFVIKLIDAEKEKNISMTDENISRGGHKRVDDIEYQ